MTHPETVPATQPTPSEIALPHHVGLGMWMETAGGSHTLCVEGGGVFEIWDNWNGSWRLMTKTDTVPFTFAASSVNIRKVLVVCRYYPLGFL